MTSQQAPEETKRPRLPGAGPLFLSAPSGTAGRLSRRGRWIPGSILECHVWSILVNAGTAAMPRAIVDGVNNPVDGVIIVIGEVRVTMPRSATASATTPAAWRSCRHRRASSLVSRLAAVRRPGSCS